MASSYADSGAAAVLVVVSAGASSMSSAIAAPAAGVPPSSACLDSASIGVSGAALSAVVSYTSAAALLVLPDAP